MFGSSEDRARQLAGRQRWKRISSSDSDSSYRSVSSSSQASQWGTSSIFEHIIQRPSPIPEHRTYTTCSIQGDQHGSGGIKYASKLAAASDVEGDMTAEHQHPRLQQHRSQAEHMSHVLYDDTTINDVLPPSSNLASLSQRKDYGVLEPLDTMLPQRRSATMPISQASPTSHQLNSLSVNLAKRPIFWGLLQANTVVSLRGGAEDESLNTNNQMSTGSTMVQTEFPWIELAIQHPCWSLPFDSGIMYNYFRESLSHDQLTTFCELFRHHSPNDHNYFTWARCQFYHELDVDGRLNFKRVIIERAKALLGPNLDKTSFSSEEVDRLKNTSVMANSGPLVCLVRLIEATVEILPPLAADARIRTSSVPRMGSVLQALG